MSRFYGTYRVTMEKTGRIRLPQALSELFSEKAILACGDQHCIEVYTPEDWEKVNEDYEKQTSPWPDDFHAKVRQRTASARETEIKAKGRLMIPAEHRSYARLRSDEDLLVMGVLNHLEIWSQDSYQDAEGLHRAQQIYGRK